MENGILTRLLTKFNFKYPHTKSPYERIREVGACWQHFSLHKRICDATGRNLISVYSEQCPYPVWQLEYWMENAAPPSAD